MSFRPNIDWNENIRKLSLVCNGYDRRISFYFKGENWRSVNNNKFHEPDYKKVWGLREHDEISFGGKGENRRSINNYKFHEADHKKVISRYKIIREHEVHRKNTAIKEKNIKKDYFMDSSLMYLTFPYCRVNFKC